MSTDAAQLDEMIIEGAKRIAENQLRDPAPDLDLARAMHLLLLLYRGVNQLYAERLASLTNEYHVAALRENNASGLLH